MLIVLSPAKTMDMSPITIDVPGTKPLYNEEAGLLAEKMREYSAGELKELLKISDKLADVNYQRYQNFNLSSTPAKQALLAYDGSVFKEIQPSTFSAGDFLYAQDHLRIVSTLYGCVRPLDLIKAYRIAFYLRLKGMDGDDLYKFWQPKLTKRLIEDTVKAGGIIINLASLDVWTALDTELLENEIKIITPEFQEYRDGKYTTVRTYAKTARGAMARYIIKNRVESPEKLLSFNYQGFIFNPEISNDRHFIFTRDRKQSATASQK